MSRLLFFLALTLISPITSLATSENKDLSKIQFKGIHIPPLTNLAPKSLSDFKGKIVVIDFWASWCGPCKIALPHYNKLYKTYKEQGVLFIGINEDDNVKDRDATLKQIPLDFPLYQDQNQEMVKQFKVQALPTLFVLNRELKVVSMFRGFDSSKPETLENTLKDLLKK